MFKKNLGTVCLWVRFTQPPHIIICVYMYICPNNNSHACSISAHYHSLYNFQVRQYHYMSLCPQIYWFFFDCSQHVWYRKELVSSFWSPPKTLYTFCICYKEASTSLWMITPMIILYQRFLRLYSGWNGFTLKGYFGQKLLIRYRPGCNTHFV